MFERMLRGHDLRASAPHIALAAMLEAAPTIVFVCALFGMDGGSASAFTIASWLAVLPSLVVSGLGWLTLGAWRPIVALSPVRLYLGGTALFAGVIGFFILAFGDGAGAVIVGGTALIVSGTLLLANLALPLWSGIEVMRRVRVLRAEPTTD
jgi:hypothetical protein